MSSDKDLKIKISEFNGFSSQEEDFQFKVVVVGDSGVGKTNLIKRFITNSFDKSTKATVGVEFMSKTFMINDEVFKVEVWDTAGQERYKSITSAYYKGASGALVVYDVTRDSSFHNVDRWIQELKEKGSQNIRMLIVGNKTDLKSERKIKSEEAFDKAKMIEIPLMETSALNASNVKEAFYLLIKEMYKVFAKERKEGKYVKNDEFGEGAGINLILGKPEKKNICCGN